MTRSITKVPNRKAPGSVILGFAVLGLSHAIDAQPDHGAADEPIASSAYDAPNKSRSGNSRLRLRIGDDRINEVSSKFDYRVNNRLARIAGTPTLWMPNFATGLEKETAPGALVTATFT